MVLRMEQIMEVCLQDFSGVDTVQGKCRSTAASKVCKCVENLGVVANMQERSACQRDNIPVCQYLLTHTSTYWYVSVHTIAYYCIPVCTSPVTAYVSCCLAYYFPYSAYSAYCNMLNMQNILGEAFFLHICLSCRLNCIFQHNLHIFHIFHILYILHIIHILQIFCIMCIMQ